MSRRPAFTLVELLVVAGIFAMLFSLILVGRRDSKQSQIKRAAQLLAAEFLKAQTRSRESDTGAALIVDPDAADTAGVLSEGAPRLPIRGLGTFVVISSTTASLGPPQPTVLNADVSDLSEGFRIQFGRGDFALPASGISPWFRYKPNGQVELRSESGQTPNNTIWPDLSISPVYDFSLLRYPTRLGNRVTLPAAAAIDLRFSGCDNDLYSTFGSLQNAGSVAVSFNSMGQVDSVARDVSAALDSRGEIEPTADLFFLVASRDSIKERTALRSSDSIWVVINPITGSVTMAANVPQIIDEALLNATTDADKQVLRTAVWNARARARSGANAL